LDPPRHRPPAAELGRVHAPRPAVVLAAPAAAHELPARADLAQGRLHPHAEGGASPSGRGAHPRAPAGRLHALPREAWRAGARELLADDGADGRAHHRELTRARIHAAARTRETTSMLDRLACPPSGRLETR